MKKGQRPSAHHRTSRRGKKFPVNQGIIKALKPMKNKEYKKLFSPYADADGDGVPNSKDCRPFDKNRQDEPELRLKYNDIEKRSSIEGRPRIFRNGKQVGFGAREPEYNNEEDFGFYEV
jgi:hypothetical protein